MKKIEIDQKITKRDQNRSKMIKKSKYINFLVYFDIFNLLLDFFKSFNGLLTIFQLKKDQK